MTALIRLGGAERGFIGQIGAIDASACAGDLPPEELERRLLEMGFAEGARVEVRHLGPVGGDPIAVLVDHTLVALRRQEADAILVEPAPSKSGQIQ
jgi:ferrous iron transport protein A